MLMNVRARRNKFPLPPTRSARGGEGRRRPTAAVLDLRCRCEASVGGGGHFNLIPHPGSFHFVKFADTPHHFVGGGKYSLRYVSGLAPPGVGEKAEQRGASRMMDDGAARHPLL